MASENVPLYDMPLYSEIDHDPHNLKDREPLDPLLGRAPHIGPPYSNALIWTDDDGDRLPVIPLAITKARLLTGDDEEFILKWNKDGGLMSPVEHAPEHSSLIVVEMMNGTELAINLAGYTGEGWNMPVFYPIRPRRILWGKSGYRSVTLLW